MTCKLYHMMQILVFFFFFFIFYGWIYNLYDYSTYKVIISVFFALNLKICRILRFTIRSYDLRSHLPSMILRRILILIILIVWAIISYCTIKVCRIPYQKKKSLTSLKVGGQSGQTHELFYFCWNKHMTILIHHMHPKFKYEIWREFLIHSLNNLGKWLYYVILLPYENMTEPGFDSNV